MLLPLNYVIIRLDPMDLSHGISLLCLPTELLATILSKFDDLSERSLLSDLCLVCRKLRAIAQPILFRSFSIPSSEYSTQGALYRLEAFTVALLHQPPLRNVVRSIDIHGPREYCVEHKKLDETSIRYTQSLLQAVDQMPFRDKAWWRNNLQNVRRSFVASLLVAMTPNLVALSIEGLDEDIKHLTKWMQLPSGDLRWPWSRPLTSLKELEISFEDTNMADMIILLQIPTLKKFSGTHCVGTCRAQSSRTLKEMLQSPIHVHTLELSLAHMDVDFINVLLSMCRSLRQLYYEPMGPEFVHLFADESHRTQQFTVGQLIIALAAYTPQLEELDVAFILCEEVDAWEPSTLPALERLTKLQKLTADYITMTAVEVLPPQLQDIMIRRCYFGIFDHRGACDLFRKLVNGKRTGAHHLNHIIVSVDNKVDMFQFLGLDRDVDADAVAVLLAAVYLQQKRFKHEGMHLEFQTKDYEGIEDIELNKQLTRNLDSIDTADCEKTLMIDGLEWDEWR